MLAFRLRVVQLRGAEAREGFNLRLRARYHKERMRSCLANSRLLSGPPRNATLCEEVRVSNSDEKARLERALALLKGRDVTSEYLLAALEGEGPEIVDERKRVREEADKIEGLPIADWPPSDVSWDTTREAQRFAFDGMKAEDFQKSVPSSREWRGRRCGGNHRLAQSNREAASDLV